MQAATAHYGQIDVVINNALVDFKFDPVAQKLFYRFGVGRLSKAAGWNVKSGPPRHPKCPTTIYGTKEW